MRYENVAIPAGFAWSSPLTKWQGSLAEISSLDLAADVAARALAERRVDPAQTAGLVLGWTIPQPATARPLSCSVSSGTTSPPRSWPVVAGIDIDQSARLAVVDASERFAGR